MEHSRMSLPPIPRAGEVATFYSYDSGAARSMALANMAVLLAARDDATMPVLMIDWDTESPTLHHVFDQRDEHAGVLELFEACRDYLQVLNYGPGGPSAAARNPCPQGDPHDNTLAMQVLDAVDWQRYVQRVDQSRSLYLLRAGCFDADYGRRASQMDWEGLFETCPALFRCFAQEAARYFRHVLVDTHGGRSTTVSICTTLVPDKLVALFTPNQRSLDGLEGVVTRAINYRRSHAEEQRPLVAYPLACAMDSTDSERRSAWRYGDVQKGVPGYQGALERLLRQCYGTTGLSLNSYLDEVQLQQAGVMAVGVPLTTRDEHGGDRFSLTRSVETLLAWVADGYFPWQSRAEITLLADIAALRISESANAPAGGRAAALPLAHALDTLGQLYDRHGQYRQAQGCFQECLALRDKEFGPDHAGSIPVRTRVADMLRQLGKLNEAHEHYIALEALAVRLHGNGHPDTLAVRAGLACTLAQQNHFAQALDIEQAVGASLERTLGSDHPDTLDSIARQADILSHQGELSRARQADERVLAGRRLIFGAEHSRTLAGMQHLAMVLCRLGDLSQARHLQEQVLAARLRHAGVDHPATVQAHEALATIFAEQGEQGGLRPLHEGTAHGRERHGGADHAAHLPHPMRMAGSQHEADSMLRLDEQADILNRRIDEVQYLVEGGQLEQARDLADSLRKPLLRPGVGPRQRIRGMAALKRVYKIQGDQQALAALHEAETRAQENPLSAVQAVIP
jgi:tetratricopeptide (TPR) repeat protein